MLKYYDSIHRFTRKPGTHDTRFEIADSDTFTEAANHDRPCCLNFASHKRPGGGYRGVMNLRKPIKTQEEDLFRRSDLPEIMDTDEVRRYYPLEQTQGLYCTATVSKDEHLNPCRAFEAAIVTVPAVVNPNPGDLRLVELKIRRILEISADQGYTTLILGAWGCGVFHNDPHHVAEGFRNHLAGDFRGVFETVVFAIPGRTTPNHRIFRERFDPST